MSYIIVGIGGILGSVARYSVGRIIGRHNSTGFPWATFLVNITGALLFGAISALNLNSMMYLLAGEGFFGAFTTFSTFMYEGVRLIKGNKHLDAAIYICITMILGIISFRLGYHGMINILLQ